MKIIVNDIVSWAKFLEFTTLTYIECQLKICQAYHLSLSLRKSHIFPSRFEFVGIDVCADGNRPAQSKHTLLSKWPAPETVRDVAKFIGFAQFYTRFIHNFELRVAPLREITKMNIPTLARNTGIRRLSILLIDDMKNAILADPCILRFDYRKLIVLRSLVGCYASQGMTRRPIRQSRNTVRVRDSIS